MSEFYFSWPPAFYELVGVIGFVLYVLNYTLLTFQKLTSEHVSYFVINWFASSLVLIGLMHSFNLAAALIQMFWIVISSVAIVIRVHNHSREKVQRRRASANPQTTATAPQQPAEPSPAFRHSQDESPKSDFRDPEYAQRTPPRAKGQIHHAG